MKPPLKMIILFFLVILLCIISCCTGIGGLSGGLSPGTYYHTDPPHEIHIGNDASFTLESESGIASGTYEVSGTTLTLHKKCTEGKGRWYSPKRCDATTEYYTWYKISNNGFCEINRDGSERRTPNCYNKH